MINQLIERRKVLLEKDLSIVDRRTEIFKTVDAAVVTEALEALRIEAQTLANDWWNFQKEVMALTPLKKLMFDLRKDL